MTIDQPQVESLGEHLYLIRVRQDDEIIEVQVRATPAVISDLVIDEADERRVVEATAAYLVARQRADDLPSQLDLDDVVAAYADFVGDLRRQLDRGRGGGSGSGAA